MKIACLGWGSLIWKPDALPVAGEWQTDGPLLPIEFARIGDGGEVATALCINAEPVPVLWAMLTVTDIAAACAALREREAIPDERCDGVGILFATAHTPGPLAEWARQRALDAVIWTDLPPRFQHTEGLIPGCEAVLAHLSSLSGETAAHAFDYLRRVPAQIATPYRSHLMRRIDELTADRPSTHASCATPPGAHSGQPANLS